MNSLKCTYKNCKALQTADGEFCAKHYPKYYKPNEVFKGELTHKELSIIEDALEISSSFKVYGEGREAHQKECKDIIKKLYSSFYN